MKLRRTAAFSSNGKGGNPAGVVIENSLPSEAEMLSIAAEVGYSETAFLCQQGDAWRIRYFAPETEVPFCGHATIAAGAELGALHGEGRYELIINDGQIEVDVSRNSEGAIRAALMSPEGQSTPAELATVVEVLNTLNFDQTALDTQFPIHVANAGATHLILMLGSRETLTKMKYDFDALKQVMHKHGFVTINLLWRETESRYHSRNLFPPGGVYEDPATGAAAAAFGAYLREIDAVPASPIEILQGDDMGVPSRLLIELDKEFGRRIKVSGEAREIAV